MLQIATGKLFSKSAWRENHLRGILYTNAILPREEIIQTIAGRLLSSSSYSTKPNVLLYEFTERMEYEGSGAGVLISSTVDPYLQDFSVVASFALNCTCTADVDLAKRLINGGRGLATRIAPQELIRKFFDVQYWCQPDDTAFLRNFTNHLIGLRRKTFLGVMRSLRTYVNGVNRVADDLELAYTLLVASVESLAQDFDGHQSSWDSLDERKRMAIDTALVSADDITSKRVREALLSVEHVSLKRRFREFSSAHIPSTYFREVLISNQFRLAKSDLSDVLGSAYNSRSRYIHNLQPLPDMVAMSHGFNEIASDGRTSNLTLQGLSRLMRSIIIEFVMRQPTVDREPYDYHIEQAGVMQVHLAPQYWVGRAEGELENAGRDKLEGFLQQLEACLLKQPDSAITDMRAVLGEVVGLFPRMSKAKRLPYLVLHALFNFHVSENDAAPTPSTLTSLIKEELSEPSSASLVGHALLEQLVDWPLDVHKRSVTDYFRLRSKASGVRFPRTFEAAISLDLAERYRLAGEENECRAIVGLSVENHPGNFELLQFEKVLDMEVPIIWRDIMLPVLQEPELHAESSFPKPNQKN